MDQTRRGEARWDGTKQSDSDSAGRIVDNDDEDEDEDKDEDKDENE